MDFYCPVCHRPLTRGEHTMHCENNHCFDLARQGYVNLLLSQSSSSKRHGDDKRMVHSRSEFLDGGWYENLRDEVTAAVMRYADPGCTLLDAGCGEGYYTAAVFDALDHAGYGASVLGVDLSRDALIAACKRQKKLKLAVGSIFALPVGDASCELVLNIFAPCAAQEFSRILKPDGILIRVVPLRRHLYELKAVVYEHPYENEHEDPSLEGFTLLSQQELQRIIRLPSTQDLQNLFAMTPYYYKTGAADQLKLGELSSLDVTTAFGILIYRKQTVS